MVEDTMEGILERGPEKKSEQGIAWYKMAWRWKIDEQWLKPFRVRRWKK
jgi:hypothetical protein